MVGDAYMVWYDDSLPLTKYILYLPLNTVSWNLECNYTIVALYLYKVATGRRSIVPQPVTPTNARYVAFLRIVYVNSDLHALTSHFHGVLWNYIQWIPFYNLSMMTIRWWWATLKRGVHVLWRSTTTQHIEIHNEYYSTCWVCVSMLSYLYSRRQQHLIHSQ